MIGGVSLVGSATDTVALNSNGSVLVFFSVGMGVSVVDVLVVLSIVLVGVESVISSVGAGDPEVTFRESVGVSVWLEFSAFPASALQPATPALPIVAIARRNRLLLFLMDGPYSRIGKFFLA